MGRRSVLTRGDSGGWRSRLALGIPTLILVVLAMLEVVVVARLQLELVAAAREGTRVAATVVDPAAAVRATTGSHRSRSSPTGSGWRSRRPTVPGRLAIVRVPCVTTW